MAAQLALADDFWMTAHDRPPKYDSSLQPKPLGIGLGAALLAELIASNWIALQDKRILLHPDAYRAQLPDDAALSGVIAEIKREYTALQNDGQHFQDPVSLPVDQWIRHLAAGTAKSLVELRLHTNGQAEKQVRSGLLRASRTVHVPKSSATSGWASSRVRLGLRDGQQLSEQDLTLAGLIVACGLASGAMSGLGAREMAFLRTQIQASVRTSLRDLIVCAEEEIGRLVMIR